MENIVLVTGGFDPLHSGHISYFKAAKKLGDKLVVGINSDDWLSRKKGKPFMPFEERAAVIEELNCVDKVISFDDSDNSACNAIEYLLKTTTNNIIFANGGDRVITKTPEYEVYKNYPSVKFAFGIGGKDKKNSSSLILKNWNQPTVERKWGKYTILDKGKGWQVKQLEFYPGHSLSNQRHFKRSEHWHIVDGVIEMKLENTINLLVPGDSIDIFQTMWHKATNIGNKSAVVIEVWLGEDLSEEDIERKE